MAWEDSPERAYKEMSVASFWKMRKRTGDKVRYNAIGSELERHEPDIIPGSVRRSLVETINTYGRKHDTDN